MIRHFAVSILVSGALAVSVSAQSRTAATAQYDPNAEATFGGVITQDPSPVSQLLMAVPLILFWEIGIIGARIVQRKRASAQVTAPAS